MDAGVEQDELFTGEYVLRDGEERPGRRGSDRERRGQLQPGAAGGVESRTDPSGGAWVPLLCRLDRSCRADPGGEPGESRRAGAPQQEPAQQHDDNHGEGGEPDAGRDVLDLPPAAAAQIAQQHRHRPPGDAAGDVEGHEGAIAQTGHAGQAGDHDPQRGGEPAEEHGSAASFGQVLLCAVEVAALHEPSHGAVQQTSSVPSADRVADGVADHGAGDPGGQDRTQRHSALVGHDAAEDERDLAGEDEPDERGGLQGWEGEHDQQRNPGWQREQVGGVGGHHRATPRSAAVNSDRSRVRVNPVTTALSNLRTAR